MGNELLNAALEYASMGYKVFPLRPRDKRPATINGFKDATSDPDQIRAWWGGNPEYNIGLPTGTWNNGLVVIDMDEDEDKGKHGYREFVDWVDDNDLYIQETPRAITGRGGYHFFFRSDHPVAQRANWLPSVDVRAEGGYIVAPPSIHPNGNKYEWEQGFDDVDPPSGDDDEDIDFMFYEINATSPSTGSEERTSDRPRFTREAAIPEGGRTQYLVSYIGQKARQNLGEDEIEMLVRSENDKCNPPLTEEELRQTVFPAIHKFVSRNTPKEEAPEDEGGEPKKKFDIPKLRLARELQQMDIPDLNVILGVDQEVPMVVEGTCIISAKSKTGKSWFCLNLCKACANGDMFLGMRAKKCHSLYIDLETGDKVAQNRFNKNNNGELMPYGFYHIQKSLMIDDGFVEMIDQYMEDDPEIGLIVVDVFQKIRKGKKNNESDYEYTYRDMNIINGLSHKYHISIILVCHDRKTVDPTDPFSNILGSTALQGASDQMIVMYKETFDSPIARISAKGRTMDGLVDMYIRLSDGGWVECPPEQVAKIKSEGKSRDDYMGNQFRIPVVDLINEIGSFRGPCNQIVRKCIERSIEIEDDLKMLGGFLAKCARSGVMEEVDGVRVRVVKNGTGAKTYELEKLGDTSEDFATVDESDLPLMVPFMKNE